MVTYSSVLFHLLVRKHLLDRVVLFLQVLALGTHSTVAFELGPMVSSIIVDTSAIHIGCVRILIWAYIVGFYSNIMFISLTHM